MSKTIAIIEKNARKAYKEGNAEIKKLIVNLCGGKDIFSENLFDRIKTFQDVCEEADVYESDYAIHSSMSPKEKVDMYDKRLKLIANVFNGDWTPKIADTSQYKYYPYFRIVVDISHPAGFRLAFRVYHSDIVFAVIGARPYFKDSATSTYVGKQFLAEYEGRAQNEELASI